MACWSIGLTFGNGENVPTSPAEVRENILLFLTITATVLSLVVSLHLSGIVASLNTVKSTTLGIVVDLWYYQLQRPHRNLDPNACSLQVLGDWSIFIISRIGLPVEEIATAMLNFFFQISRFQWGEH